MPRSISQPTQPEEFARPAKNPNPALRGRVFALKNTENLLQEISRKLKPLPVFGIFAKFSTDIHIEADCPALATSI
jgi:hypothetical protein